MGFEGVSSADEEEEERSVMMQGDEEEEEIKYSKASTKASIVTNPTEDLDSLLATLRGDFNNVAIRCCRLLATNGDQLETKELLCVPGG